MQGYFHNGQRLQAEVGHLWDGLALGASEEKREGSEAAASPRKAERSDRPPEDSLLRLLGRSAASSLLRSTSKLMDGPASWLCTIAADLQQYGVAKACSQCRCSTPLGMRYSSG